MAAGSAKCASEALFVAGGREVDGVVSEKLNAFRNCNRRNAALVVEGASFSGILNVIVGKCIMKPPSLIPFLVSQRLCYRHRRQRLSGKSLADEPG